MTFVNNCMAKITSNDWHDTQHLHTTRIELLSSLLFPLVAGVPYCSSQKQITEARSFQKFIYEHNLWGTTAVLALSVHASVENNNFEFFLSVKFFLFFYSFLVSRFLNCRISTQLKVKVLDLWQHWHSINKPRPPIAAPTICTQLNYIVQIKKDTLLHHRQRVRHVSLLLESHILRKFRLVQRGGCKTSWNIIYIYVQRLVLRITRGKFTQRRPSNSNIPQVSER